MFDFSKRNDFYGQKRDTCLWTEIRHVYGQKRDMLWTEMRHVCGQKRDMLGQM